MGSPAWATPIQVSQDFNSNPGDWVGNGNVSGNNNFGWSNTNLAHGAAQGEAGGVFSRQDVGQYSTDIGSIDLSDTAFSVSGHANLVDQTTGCAFLGYFDSTGALSYPPANFIGAELPYQNIIYATAHAPSTALQEVTTGASMSWDASTGIDFTMTYDPLGNSGGGQLVLSIDSPSHSPGHGGPYVATINLTDKNAFANLDRFGLMSEAPIGTLPKVNTVYFDDLVYTANIPEPSTLVLLSSGLIGLLAYAWRKRK